MQPIRTLKPDELELRVQSVKENGFSLLLYKNARVDMAILDEVFGPLNWQREHDVINGNLFCTVSIYNEATGQWIRKQDVGVESNTEKEKGQASDSFKRACTNIGIGRELYAAPFIWIVANTGEIYDTGRKDKYQKPILGVSKFVSFEVSQIECNENKEVIKLVLIDQNGKVRFNYSKGSKAPVVPVAPVAPVERNKESTNTVAPPKGQIFNGTTPIAFKCSNPHGVEIEKNVNDYSVKKYGKALCRDCQKEFNKKIS